MGEKFDERGEILRQGQNRQQEQAKEAAREEKRRDRRGREPVCVSLSLWHGSAQWAVSTEQLAACSEQCALNSESCAFNSEH